MNDSISFIEDEVSHIAGSDSLNNSLDEHLDDHYSQIFENENANLDDETEERTESKQSLLPNDSIDSDAANTSISGTSRSCELGFTVRLVYDPKGRGRYVDIGGNDF
jgi:hypothetical protein